MKHRFRLLALLAIGSLGWMTTGCATHTGEGVFMGSLLGAGAGAIIGHAAGDSGAGALIGAGSGALLGGLIGNSYDAYDLGYRQGHAVPAPPTHSHYAPPPRVEYYEHHYYDYAPRHYSYSYSYRPRHYSHHRKSFGHGHGHNYGYRYDRYCH